MRSSATPRLYQEIRERGLHSTNQDELLDDFVVVEAPVEDQGIVVKSYRPAQLTWSQLSQVDLHLPSNTICKHSGKQNRVQPKSSANVVYLKRRQRMLTASVFVL